MNQMVEEEDRKSREVARNKKGTGEEQNTGEGSANRTGEGGCHEPQPEEKPIREEGRQSAEDDLQKPPAEDDPPRLSAEDDRPRQSAEDDRPRHSADDDRPRQSAEDDRPRLSAEDNPPRLSAEDDRPRLSAEDDRPRQSAEDDRPRQSAEDDRPRQSAEDDPPRLSAEDDRPRQSAEDDRPRQSAEDDRPRQSAEDDRPRQSAEDDRPRQSAEDDRPRQSAEDDRPRQSAEDDRPRQSAEDDPPQKPSKDDRLRQSAEDDPPRLSAEDDRPRLSAEDDPPRLSAEDDLSQLPAQDYPPQEPAENVGEGTADKSATGDPGQSLEQDPQPQVISPIKYIPANYLIELAKVLFLGLTLFVVEFETFLIGLVSTAFSGHLGAEQLSSAALAIAMFNIAGLSIAMGFAQTCDTLISQTYGGGNLERVKVLMQRALLFMLLACFVCCGVLFYTEPVILLLNQTSEVASMAQTYVYILMPAVPACFIYQLQLRCLQNQKIVFPQIAIGIVALILNGIIHHLFLNVLKLGLVGSALAGMSSHYFFAGFLWLYIRFKKIHGATWSGWSLDCLQEWGSFSLEALCSTAMLCLEFWVFELWIFLAGSISEFELGVQTVIYNVYIAVFLVPLGLSAAASIRVGNALGANNVERAKLSSKIVVFCGVVTAVVSGALMIMLRNKFGQFFSKDTAVISKAADDMLFFAAIFFVDSIACVLGGVIRGAGKLWIGALSHAVCHYLIGIPICCWLMSKMGILGIQIGMAVGVASLLSVFTVTLCRLDWEKAAKNAQTTAGILIKDEIEMNNLGPSAEAAVVEDPVPVRTTTVVGDVLSVKQLILRRGSVLFSVMVIFGALIIGRFSMKLYLPVANSTTPFNTTNTTTPQVPF